MILTWLWLLSKYGIDKFKTEIELCLPFSKWKGRVLFVYNQSSAVSVLVTKEIYDMIDHPAIRVKQQDVFDKIPDVTVSADG